MDCECGRLVGDEAEAEFVSFHTLRGKTVGTRSFSGSLSLRGTPWALILMVI